MRQMTHELAVPRPSYRRFARLAGARKWHVGVDAQRELAAHEATAKATQKTLERIDQAAVGHEADKSQIRTQIKTIIKEVDRVVQKPVLRDTVCFDDDGLRLIRAALGPAASAGEPAPAVP